MTTLKSLLIVLLIVLGCKSSGLPHQVTINRPVCFASCRAYTFTAHKNNMMLQINLKDKQFPIPLSSEQQQTFRTLLNTIEFTDLDSFYGNKRVYDIPEVSIQYHNTNTIIKGIHFAPKKLQTLLTQISNIVQTTPIEKLTQ